VFRTLKVFDECYPTKFAGSTQNPKKIIGKSNEPIKPKLFQKKCIAYPQEEDFLFTILHETPEGIEFAG
jgi:hypothetical protein